MIQITINYRIDRCRYPVCYEGWISSCEKNAKCLKQMTTCFFISLTWLTRQLPCKLYNHIFWLLMPTSLDIEIYCTFMIFNLFHLKLLLIGHCTILYYIYPYISPIHSLYGDYNLASNLLLVYYHVKALFTFYPVLSSFYK